MFGGSELTAFVINFVNHLDPNGSSGSEVWPKYTAKSPAMLAFLDNTTQPLTVIQDTYREEAIAFVTELFTKYPLTGSAF
jgi:acetylcholinesterase